MRVDAGTWIDYLQIAKWDGRWQIVNVLWELKQEDDMAKTPDRDGSHDFDFQTGHWRIHNGRLSRAYRGARSGRPSRRPRRPSCSARTRQHRSLLTVVLAASSGCRSASSFGARGVEYLLGDNRVDRLLPPVVGLFHRDVGVFYGRQELDGRRTGPVHVVFDHHPNGARWEQAFSPDDGTTWESNWVMTLTRELER